MNLNCWGTLSTTAEKEVSINISPTITNRTITISGLYDIEFKLLIYNQLGQKMIYSRTSKTIDVSSFPSGLYILNLETTIGNYQSKFIVK